MRRLVLVVAFAFAVPFTSASQQKVIVVGFDGADARYTERWMNEGKLPNLAKLRAMGTFRPLRPTLPAQTPVSWSTFSTGIDPGRTGIFDFLRRDPRTYLPLFAAFDEIKEPFLLGEKTREDILIEDLAFYNDHGIEVRLSQPVVSVDFDAKTLDCHPGGEVAFEHLLITAGSKVRHIEAAGG